MELTDGDVVALAQQAVELLAPDIEIFVEPGQLDDPYRWRSRAWTVYPLIDGVRSFGIRLTANTSPVEAFAHLVDSLSEYSSETKRFWGVPFPPCPGHQHPAAVSERTGEAVVVRCPATHELVAELRPEL